MKFVLINESTEPTLTAEVLQLMASALTIQSARDFPTLWESLPCSVRVDTALQQGERGVRFVDDIPEAPGALAYHSVDSNGNPILVIGVGTILKAGGTLTTGPMSISSAVSHEMCEANQDEFCAFYSIWPADPTKMVSLEVCDPVEGDYYDINGVSVSNFVGPKWFDAGGAGPYDFMGTLSAPFTMSPGGYLAFLDGSQIYGDQMPQWKRGQKAKYSRRA